MLSELVFGALAGVLAVVVVLAGGGLRWLILRVRAGIEQQGEAALGATAGAAAAIGGRRKLWVVAIIVIAALIVLWLLRYEVVAVSHGEESIAYRLDRWTGTTSFCVPSRCRAIPEM